VKGILPEILFSYLKAMRLWSIHPKYLDSKGLLALWREALLAECVLKGMTKGYRHHPQLKRFLATPDPLESIHCYLQAIYRESLRRGYSFDPAKIAGDPKKNSLFSRKKARVRLPVTTGQLRYEREHLLKKLKQRNPERYAVLRRIREWDPHPLFQSVPGPVEPWEKIIGPTPSRSAFNCSLQARTHRS
jgi:hypothetical protein